jgi:serine protease Do
MELGPVTPQDQRELKLESARGALITAVEPDSPAARAGLAPGEVIVRVGRRAVTTAREANDELSRIPSGGTALMRVIRGGNEIFVSVAKD